MQICLPTLRDVGVSINIVSKTVVIEMHIHYIDTVNDTVNTKNDTVNDTVFYLISQNNEITATEISQRLNISLSTVKRKIKELKDNETIERIGSAKTGQWKIISK